MSITAAGKTKILENLELNLEVIALHNSGGEFFRKTISDQFIDGDTLICDMFLDETEANDLITKINLFGWGATITPLSGTQFSDDSVSFSKTNAETMTISAEIQVVEV